MKIEPPLMTKKRLRTAGIVAGVSEAHLVVFAGLAFLLTAPVVIVWKRPVLRLGVVPSLAVLVAGRWRGATGSVVEPGDPFEIEGLAVGLIRNTMLM